MVDELSPSSEPSLPPSGSGAERRRHPRIRAPFPTQVSATDANGERFTLETLLDDLSAGGLYLRLPKRLEPGAKIFAVVQFSDTPERPAARVAVRGVVRRVKPEADGSSGVAVQFTRHRFL